MTALGSSQLSNHEFVLPERPAAAMAIDALSSHHENIDKNVAPFPSYRTGGFSETVLQDIDEFDKLFPYNPKPKLIPMQSEKVTCENTVKFQHICDQRSITPVFTYSGDRLAGGFIAKLEFGTQTVETTSRASSKKGAKEAACKLALAQLPSLESVRGTKRKSVDATPEVDKSENWVGILVEHAQRKKVAFPEYEEFVTYTFPLRFGCTVTISGIPSIAFGLSQGPFNSKQAAKTAASREAVMWLRAQGIIPETPVKRLKSISPESLPTPAGRTAQTQVAQDVDMSLDGSLPPSVQLHHLVRSMGFIQPRFECKLSKTKHGEVAAGVPIYDAAVFFDPRDTAKEPRLAGPIGRVERILGQKKAKAVCYEFAIIHLELIQDGMFT